MTEWNAQELLNAEKRTAMAHIEALTAEFDDIVAGTADGNTDDEHDPEGSTLAFERATGFGAAQPRAGVPGGTRVCSKPGRGWHLRSLYTVWLCDTD
jgi:hypothetical protein